MGEKIKDLSTCELKDSNFFIELNHGNKGSGFNIHIQNELIQFLFKYVHFIEFASSTAIARKNEINIIYEGVLRFQSGCFRSVEPSDLIA